MSVDAGMADLMDRLHTVSGPGVEVTAGLDVQVGRLCSLMERQLAEERVMAESITIVDLAPLDFQVTAGQPRFKGYRASGADMSPQEGFWWFVTRLSLAGMNAGDEVNLYRTSGAGAIANAYAVHMFIGRASATNGLAVDDWEPGIAGLVMRPDDTFLLGSGGTVGATELILHGQAIQVAVPYLTRFLL